MLSTRAAARLASLLVAVAQDQFGEFPRRRLTRSAHAAAAAVEQALELVLRDGGHPPQPFPAGRAWRSGQPTHPPHGRASDGDREAVERRMIQALMKRLVKQGLEGDVQAAKIVLERVAGKPGTEQPAPVSRCR